MKAADKPQFVKEARDIYSSLDLEEFIKDPNNINEISKINRLIAIFKNFSSNDGQDLKNLLQEYQKTARKSTSQGTIKNRVVDMLQFIDQKIQEMDLYVIDDPVENKPQELTKKIVKKLKNDKFKVQSNQDGDDEHIFIWDRDDHSGKHVHLVVDGGTGEVRIDPKDKPPHDLLKKVVTVTTRGGMKIRSTKATLEFIEEDDKNSDIPVLDLEWTGSSGGPTGHFAQFKITNISQTQRAIDCQWEVRGFNYSVRSPDSDRFSLQPNFSKEVMFRIDGEYIFQQEVPELSLVMEYKAISGKTYFTRRELKQVRVPSGAFYQLEKGEKFYPAEQIMDVGIKSISEPYSTGDNEKCDFELNVGGVRQMISIGVSRTLLSTWDIGDTKEKVRAAIAELGSRMVKKMLTKGTPEDFMFLSYDFPQEYQTGFEGYKKLRDSL